MCFVLTELGTQMHKNSVESGITIEEEAADYIANLNRKGPKQRLALIDATNRWVNNLTSASTDGINCPDSAFCAYAICNHMHLVKRIMELEKMSIKQAGEHVWTNYCAGAPGPYNHVDYEACAIEWVREVQANIDPDALIA